MQLRAYNTPRLEDRIRVLKRLAWSSNGGLRDPRLRKAGLQITAECPARDYMCELRAIFDFVTHNIRYTGDITGKDTFQTALRTLDFRGGDCDDHSVLTAVLATENGFNTRWRVTSNTGATWDHIYTIAQIPRTNHWIALDTTLGAGRFNRHPPQAKHQEFSVS